MNENSSLVGFNILNAKGAKIISCPNCLSSRNVNKTFVFLIDNSYL